MIKNYSQFKTYFYLYLLDFEDLNNKLLEKKLKHYLMYHGISLGVYKESPDTKSGYMLVDTYICHSLEELVNHYNEFGDLN